MLDVIDSGKEYNTARDQIIVRFHHYADRQLVWSKRVNLKNTTFSLHENYANEVEYRRRLMYPIMSAARRSPNFHKVYLNGDVLRVDDIDYTVESLHNLPEEIHPRNFSVKVNEQWQVFEAYAVRLIFYPIIIQLQFLMTVMNLRMLNEHINMQSV